jgi:hypothetical protein
MTQLFTVVAVLVFEWLIGRTAKHFFPTQWAAFLTKVWG